MTKQLFKQQRRLDLDLMRGLAIIAVIVIHCIAPVVTMREVESASWIIGNILDGAMGWAVPLFVIISGGLLIKDSTYLKIDEFYKKRLKRIILPLIAWPIIYYIWYILTIKPADTSDFIHAYLTGKPLGGFHLYFLFLIAGLYAIAPILSAFVSVVSKRQAWIACVAILIVTAYSLHLSQFLNLSISYNIFTYFLPYIGYFLLGYLLVDLKTRFHNILTVSGLLIIAMASTISYLSYFTMKYDRSLPFYQFTGFTVILLTLGMFFFIQRMSDFLKEGPQSIIKVAKSLSYNSLGIYLVHVIILQGLIEALKLNKASVATALMLMPSTLLLSWILVIFSRRIKIIKLFFE